jgi:tRNA/rRNA methyltransferase
MSFWTYILRLSNGIYYTGHTDDLDRRVAEHQSGAIKGYTRDKRPLELMWADEFPTRAEALEAELRIKSWSRSKKEALIAGNWERLSAPRCRLRNAEDGPRLRSTGCLDFARHERSYPHSQPHPFAPSEVEGPCRAKPRPPQALLTPQPSCSSGRSSGRISGRRRGRC